MPSSSNFKMQKFTDPWSFNYEIVLRSMVFLSSEAALSGGTVLMYMPVLFSKPAQIARLG
jgi:hypothetical protein